MLSHLTCRDWFLSTGSLIAELNVSDICIYIYICVCVYLEYKKRDMTRMHHLYSDLVTEARSIQTESEKVMSSSVANGDKHQWLLRLQRVMLALREVGNEKLEITSQMLDTVSMD